MLGNVAQGRNKALASRSGLVSAVHVLPVGKTHQLSLFRRCFTVISFCIRAVACRTVTKVFLTNWLSNAVTIIPNCYFFRVRLTYILITGSLLEHTVPQTMGDRTVRNTHVICRYKRSPWKDIILQRQSAFHKCLCMVPMIISWHLLVTHPHLMVMNGRD